MGMSKKTKIALARRRTKRAKKKDGGVNIAVKSGETNEIIERRRNGVWQDISNRVTYKVKERKEEWGSKPFSH